MIDFKHDSTVCEQISNGSGCSSASCRVAVITIIMEEILEPCFVWLKGVDGFVVSSFHKESVSNVGRKERRENRITLLRRLQDLLLAISDELVIAQEAYRCDHENENDRIREDDRVVTAILVFHRLAWVDGDVPEAIIRCDW